MSANIREMFPGGNTACGFCSFYDYIIGPEATRIFIIKGGPGVGKSTLMRQIGEDMLQRGYDVELHHCSSDNGSLDGVVVPSIKVALIDGTAPHIVDPKNPGAVDEIVHLGDYWDEEGLREHKNDIIEHNRQIKRYFERAYRYLGAAKSIRDNIVFNVSSCINKGKLYHLIHRITNMLFEDFDAADHIGKQRHMFASAITPDGVVDHLDTLIKPQARRYVLVADVGSGSDEMLKRIADAAVIRGYDVELYHCALVPEEVEHLVIPALGAAFTIDGRFASDCTEVYDLNDCMDKHKYALLSNEINTDRDMMNTLIGEAVNNIAVAKGIHDEMEAYYISNMRFDEVQQVKDRLLQRILAYAGR